RKAPPGGPVRGAPLVLVAPTPGAPKRLAGRGLKDLRSCAAVRETRRVYRQEHSPAFAAFRLVIVGRVEIDCAKNLNDTRLLVPANIFLERLGHRFFLCLVAAHSARFLD